eukprot:TRINITY_DN1680_c0_g1_i2.p1 TRINITY_DN1680_c0_g1~~TRINITY_DN1680_c0_g1_i2.p1  ORF type:complete len:1430 (+),score=347.90 TRINITY_DN1680_c0_g1_i2:54-4343(+)
MTLETDAVGSDGVSAQNASAEPNSKRARRGHMLTVQQIVSDRLTMIAQRNWALDLTRSGTHTPAFDPTLVADIYHTELKTNESTRLMLLEFSGYLENYLWPNFDARTSSVEHVLSIMMIVNEKFRESVPAWDCFQRREPAVFNQFFQRVIHLRTQHALSPAEKRVYIIFLIRVFQSLENELLRKPCLKLVSLPLWRNLNPKRRQRELKQTPELEKHWKYMEQQAANGVANAFGEDYEMSFFPSLVEDFLETLQKITPEQANPAEIRYCEHFVEFLIDIESQLPTRRFTLAYLEDTHIIIKCERSELIKMTEGSLFGRLIEILKFYLGFEINVHTGLSLTEDDITAIHSERLVFLQRLAFKEFRPALTTLAMSSIGAIESRSMLMKHLSTLSHEDMVRLGDRLMLLGKADEAEKLPRDILLEIIVSRHEKRMSQIETINEMPLYPDENLLWDFNLVPDMHYYGDNCLALPKLNLQFLTFHDYLLRNFNLFRLESTYEVREDVQDIVKRLNPRMAEDGTTVFQGWARQGIVIQDFKVTKVSPPLIGEKKPSQVLAEVTVDIRAYTGPIRQEWDNLRLHDVILLVGIESTTRLRDERNPKFSFCDQYGVRTVRGGEIVEVLDENGTVIDEFKLAGKPPAGTKRTYRILLDQAQYLIDSKGHIGKGVPSIYKNLNILIRRKPKENNFKAVLETIRSLMNTKCVVPDWLHDVFLGYGDPGAAYYRNMQSQLQSFDFLDTFLDVQHLKESFPGKKFKFLEGAEQQNNPPFRLRFPEIVDGVDKGDEIEVESYKPLYMGPYPTDQRKTNRIRFTPVQVEAIRSGMSHGLTMVVGPPGTGKTDVAVQIISNLYHNYPDQHTLIVTHSNQALNQLFEKIMALDIEERHLVRLGHGEELLETNQDFSKGGRVNNMLQRRMEFLGEVERLAKSIGVQEDVGYTCETAGHFYLQHVLSRWELYEDKCNKSNAIETVQQDFPFAIFFSTAPQPIFLGNSFEEDWEIAQGCFRHLKKIFTELEECRAFELLRSQGDRTNYLLTKQAKIIAMTCTHAALKRRELAALGFRYDNILMEEAAQILEIETFIPMLLQNPEDGMNRLKRVILIGDHNQLPPVVKNMAFQKYGHLDQSLFTRFVRLNVPTFDLDQQGRCRPEISGLFNWRYKKLGNLPSVLQGDYSYANPGFCFNFQFIDVGDFDGKGETEPNPYFYQNLGEAEYVTALFMYMRLIGYPADKIAILTTYNGQKHLIRDVIAQRCKWHPFFGSPSKITTVDRYQGQQNDYILLSLVRTKAVGHVRDVRRLVVAMSRARLGLYVVGRRSLFENCYELTPTFNQLCSRPTVLHLNPGERFNSGRLVNELPRTPSIIPSVTQLSSLVFNMTQGYTAVAPAPETEPEPEPSAEHTKEEAATEKPTEQPKDEAVMQDVEAKENPVESENQGETTE